MSPSRRIALAGLLGFSVGVIPFQCMGFPIYKGKPCCIQFQAIMGRIKVRLATWKSSLLSIMGWVQLVKSIIHRMLVYSFHIYLWLVELLNLLDCWIKNFNLEQ